jgi:hypothetical protein
MTLNSLGDVRTGHDSVPRHTLSFRIECENCQIKISLSLNSHAHSLCHCRSLRKAGHRGSLSALSLRKVVRGVSPASIDILSLYRYVSLTLSLSLSLSLSHSLTLSVKPPLADRGIAGRPSLAVLEVSFYVCVCVCVCVCVSLSLSLALSLSLCLALSPPRTLSLWSLSHSSGEGNKLGHRLSPTTKGFFFKKNYLFIFNFLLLFFVLFVFMFVLSDCLLYGLFMFVSILVNFA